MPKSKFNQEVKTCTLKTETLRKEAEEDRHRWRGILYDDWRNNVKMSVLPKAIYTQCNPSQDSNGIFFFLTKTEKTILTFARNNKRPQMAKAVLKNRARGIMLPDLQSHDKATAIRTLWHVHKRHMAQWHRTESPEINLHVYGQLIYDKGAKNIQQGKGQSL